MRYVITGQRAGDLRTETCRSAQGAVRVYDGMLVEGFVIISINKGPSRTTSEIELRRDARKEGYPRTTTL